MSDDGLPTVDPERLAGYAERARSLPGASVAAAFPAVRPRERPDPENAFLSTFLADAPIDGPLADLGLAVKDNVAVHGTAMTCGTTAFRWTPDRDATVVARLRANGAGVVGTTNMDPFGLGTTGEWSEHGRTENPAVEGAVPGGSSSGSAAAVASGTVDAAIGTDTSGSVRIPASFCGIVGFKPTYGLVPRDGVVDLSPSNDHVGVLARDVRTAARVLEAIAGQGTTDLSTLPAASRLQVSETLENFPDSLDIGVPASFMTAAADPVEGTVESALVPLLTSDAVDVDVRDVSFPEHDAAVTVNDVQTVVEFAELLRRGGSFPGRGRRAGMREALAAVRDAGYPLPGRVRELLALGGAVLDDEPETYGATWDTRKRVLHRQSALFGQVDLLATPTTPMTAPEFGTVGWNGEGSEDGDDHGSSDGDDDGDGVTVLDTVRNTAPFNVTGAPAVTVPCGEVGGAPVGLQFVGPPGSDGLVLRVAALAERHLDDSDEQQAPEPAEYD